ncbi:indole-2-monooxygenase-like [Hordeum vulgare subsp. vulgare]|uniref:indole-2-monooxygenase-like n=1 Tax=Hordeum vulgare subsp. vulgare TaxID=112509 RepID=UPI001B85291C|nr:indole-2-monooxygenase-like [Hordeum vulgare subsp. vulgare]
MVYPLHGIHELLLQPRSPHAALGLVFVLLVCPLLVLLAVRRLATPSTAAATARAREELLSRLPSPSSRLPVIGHLHLVGSLPHISLRDLAAKHGRDGLMLLRLGAVPTLVVSSPSAAQAVLRTHDHVFASRPYSLVSEILLYGPSDVAFCPYGEHWRQVKKISTTHLLTNKKVRSYRHAREHEVRLVVAKIHNAASKCTAVDMSELLNTFSNDIVCHAVSGKLFRERGHNKLFRELVEANSLLLGGFNLVDYFPKLVQMDIIKRMVCAKAQKVKNMWDNLLNNIIDEHANKSVPEHNNEDSDFTDVLLSIQQEYKLTRDHIKAQLESMFEAGTDTSFIVLEYAMVQLMQNPHLMNKLQAEVRSTITKGKEMITEDDLDNLAYLKAVIKETLRLHMPGPLLIPHLSMADCNVNGYMIPSGIRVVINSWALARDPDSWEHADQFMPERFMECGSAATLDYKGNDFSYLPFGTGRRSCPGTNFAIATIEIMLVNLIYHFNWKLPKELMEGGISMTELFGMTVHRKEKLLLVPVVPRQ